MEPAGISDERRGERVSAEDSRADRVSAEDTDKKKNTSNGDHMRPEALAFSQRKLGALSSSRHDVTRSNF